MSVPPTPIDRRPRSTRTLGLIRMSMLIGVLGLGATSYFTREHRELRPHPELQLPLAVAWVIACAAIVLCMSRVRRARSEDQIARFSLIGWAASEAAGLFGGAYYYQTGDPRWLGAGLVLMAMTFVAIPLRSR